MFPGQWQYIPQSQNYSYNFLPSSLTNNDLKVGALDEALLSGSSAPTTQTSSKKRKAEDDLSFVKLTREQLLVMSSQELEDRVRTLQNMRPLTVPEDEEIKRQRKLIKNREYAQTSRIKKRETLSSLQVQLTAVNTENQILKTHITNLSQQVQYLQEENHQLRMMLASYSVAQPTIPQITAACNFIPNNPAPSSPSTYAILGSPSSHSLDENVINNSDSDETSVAIDFTNEHDIFPAQSNNLDDLLTLSGKNWMTDNYTTGLCLLVILFSFGLFFNSVLIKGVVGPSFASTSPSPSASRTLFGYPVESFVEDTIENDPGISAMDAESCNKTETVDNMLQGGGHKGEIMG
jgi:hypothetical protein